MYVYVHHHIKKSSFFQNICAVRQILLLVAENGCCFDVKHIILKSKIAATNYSKR